MKNHSNRCCNALNIYRCALVAAAAVTVAQRTSCDAFAPASPLLPLEHGTPSSSLVNHRDNLLSNHQPKLIKITKHTSVASYTPIELPAPFKQRKHSEDSLSDSSFIPVSSSSSSRSPSHQHHRQKKTMQRPTLDSALYPSSKKKNNNTAPKKIPSVGRLLAQEETDHCFRIRTYRAAVQLREELVHSCHGMHVHPTEKQWAAACGCSVANLRRILREGQEARTALVAAHAGLVVQQAQRHFTGLKQATQANGGLGTILTVSDMIQEGNLGLMEAAERFDPNKGCRFSTYATWWVRQRILRSISESSRTIRLPAHVHDLLQRMRKAKQQYKQQVGREPTLAELSHYMEVPEETLRRCTTRSRNVMSLERPVDATTAGPDDRRTLGDMVACSDALTPEEDAVHESLRHEIRTVLDSELLQSERQVLTCRFGLAGQPPLTVSETALKLDLSRDRVRHLEARALNKLRQPTSNYRLRDYFCGGNTSTREEEHQLSEFSSALEETFANSPSSPTKTTTQDTERPDRLWFF